LAAFEVITEVVTRSHPTVAAISTSSKKTLKRFLMVIADSEIRFLPQIKPIAQINFAQSAESAAKTL
jgi:hypothetical protein